jgi:hypothetical protein
LNNEALHLLQNLKSILDGTSIKRGKLYGPEIVDGFIALLGKRALVLENRRYFRE